MLTFLGEKDDDEQCMKQQKRIKFIFHPSFLLLFSTVADDILKYQVFSVE
jgi:hypothetical protein